jgi:ligand-binding sensor domain-containing protein/serine phosphatase RsbU (regulator of sigma subunit)
MKNTIFLCLAFFFYGFFAQAQKPRVKFEKLSVEEGLSQSTIIDMIRDDRGFMWFATLDGLNKYDGYTMEVYWNSPTKKKALPDNITPVLYETSGPGEPVLWVGTMSGGLCRYNRFSDDFTTYTHAPDDPNSISNDLITAVTGDNETLWVGTHDGLNRFDVASEKFIRCEPTLFSNDTVTTLHQTGHVLWVGTQDGFTIFDYKKNASRQLKLSDGLPGRKVNAVIQTYDSLYWIAGDAGLVFIQHDDSALHDFTGRIKSTFDIDEPDVTDLLEDADSSIWIATRNNGLLKYDRKADQLYQYSHNPFLKNSLSINSVLSLYRDRTNILWVGTSLGGVNKWNRAAEELAVFRHNPYDENSLSASQVRSIFIDREGVIWVGTVEGGLNKWIKEKNEFKHYTHQPANPHSLSHNHVRALFEDDRQNFFVATDGGGLNVFNRKTGKFKAYKHKANNPKSIGSNRVWDVLQDSRGRIWLATHGGGLNLFDIENESFERFKHKASDKSSLSNDLTTLVFEDSRELLWVGTMNGLNRWYPEERKFLRYQHEPENPNSLTNNRIYSIHEDSEGFLWIGTKGGLNRFDVESGSFKHFTTDNSDLPNNVILGILEEGDNLWMSTNRGLVRMNKETFKIKNFNMGDGLQNNEFLAGAYCKAQDGEMFFGGIDGFNAFYPGKVKDNPYAPQVLITEFRVSNKVFKTDTAISEKKHVKLKHNQNDISFGFVALDFIFPTENRYAFKLEPYDDEWNYVGTRRFATYTNLQPGDYTFRVKGANSDEVWNEEGTALNITIEPAFWQTLWFKLLIVFLLIVLVVSIYRIRVRRIKLRNKELERLVKIRTAEIRQQNEEITAQRDEIQKQNTMISRQNEEITDSIRYAERIQTAALPGPQELKELLPEHFIFFRPRDIVSGDFFWANRQNGKTVITAADCTGHGVPGAFMSMLGISFLNKIVNEKKITDAAEILNRLRKNVIAALRQKGLVHESKEGMDMALLVIDHEKKKLQFAGAFNPLVLVRDKKDTEYKAERMPVAIYEAMEPFKNTEIDYQSGDAVYMFSDGFPDQFGGPRIRKFMKKPFRKKLTEISHEPMNKQHQILEQVYDNWKGDEPQVDDVVVIGIRL